MLFSSVPFLFHFLPAALLIYFAAPRQLKNAVLLLASLFFYAWGEPKYMLLMLVSIVQGYGFGLLIEKHRGQKASKVFLTLSILVSLGLLGYFKYADFFLSSVNAAEHISRLGALIAYALIRVFWPGLTRDECLLLAKLDRDPLPYTFPQSGMVLPPGPDDSGRV